MAQPLKIAIAGAGMISWHHLVAWKNLGSRVEVVAVCDPDDKRAVARASEFGAASTFRDAQALFASQAVDVLDVASPRETHAAWVDAAAARGIPVLCQKPLAPTLALAESLVTRVAGKTRLMIHENWRFRPWYRVLKDWIGRGDLGDLVVAKMALIGSGALLDENGKRPSFERQPFMAHEERLMLAEVLIHHIDVMRFLCGELRVIGARVSDTPGAAKGETTAAVFFESAGGAPVDVIGTIVAPGFPPRPSDRLEIIGTRASAVFDDWELRLLGPEQRVEQFDKDNGYQGSFDATIAHFVDCLESSAPFETGPADNLETMRLVEHAYWAAGRHKLTMVRS
jgi:D-apiose dehydrogenase